MDSSLIKEIQSIKRLAQKHRFAYPQTTVMVYFRDRNSKLGAIIKAGRFARQYTGPSLLWLGHPIKLELPEGGVEEWRRKGETVKILPGTPIINAWKLDFDKWRKLAVGDE